MFGIAAVGYDDFAIEYHVIRVPVSVVWLLLRMQISFQHSSSQRKEPGGISRPEFMSIRNRLPAAKMGTQFKRMTDSFEAERDSYPKLQSTPGLNFGYPRRIR